MRKGEQLLSLSHSEPFISPDSGSLFYVRNIRRTVMLWKFRAKKSGTFSGRGRPAVRGGEMKTLCVDRIAVDDSDPVADTVLR